MQINEQTNKTPSIIKFISKLPHKKDKPINAESVSNEPAIFKSNITAEKRNLSDTDETSVKRLKLEDTSKVEIVKKVEDGCQNKENKVVCITLE